MSRLGYCGNEELELAAAVFNQLKHALLMLASHRRTVEIEGSPSPSSTTLVDAAGFQCTSMTPTIANSCPTLALTTHIPVRTQWPFNSIYLAWVASDSNILPACWRSLYCFQCHSCLDAHFQLNRDTIGWIEFWLIDLCFYWMIENVQSQHQRSYVSQG